MYVHLKIILNVFKNVKIIVISTVNITFRNPLKIIFNHYIQWYKFREHKRTWKKNWENENLKKVLIKINKNVKKKIKEKPVGCWDIDFTQIFNHPPRLRTTKFLIHSLFFSPLHIYSIILAFWKLFLSR